MFVDTEVSAGVYLPVAISMTSDRVPKDLVKLDIQIALIDVYEIDPCQNGRMYENIKDSSVSETARIRDIYDRYFQAFDRSGFEADSNYSFIF